MWSRFPEGSAARQQGKPVLVPTVGSRGPGALENSGVGVRGTSDQQVLAKRDQDWWLLPDRTESTCAGFPQKVLGPARNHAVASHGHHRMQ